MDSLLIEQVLLNLLENAVFHAKGMTELMLSVSLVGDKAVFEVADNGCGIPEDALQRFSAEAMKVRRAGGRDAPQYGDRTVCVRCHRQAHGSDITAETGRAAVRHSACAGRGGEDDGQ